MTDALVAYPGPRGSLGEAAADRYFGADARRRAYGSLDAVHAAVAGGECSFGVLPLESSVEGPVNRSHDLLYACRVKVVGEVLLSAPAGPASPPEEACLRYGVIAQPTHPPHDEDDRLMVAVSLPQRPGSLLELLSPLAQRRLSVEHWCSRPARVEGWQYRFHFTIAAPPDHPDVQRALQEAAALACELRVLGRFPSAGRS